MIPVSAALLVDPPTGLFLVWGTLTLAFVVVGITWLFRPAEAVQPFKILGVVWVAATLMLGVVTARIFRPARNGVMQVAKAPDFTITTLDGSSYTRDSLRGKVVLIEFWASWCGPCREALPEMVKLYHEFSGKRFLMIGISEDQDQMKLEDFVAQNRIRWQQDWDPKEELLNLFQTSAIPSYILIDADGRMRFSQHGWNQATYPRLRAAISEALGTSTSAASRP